MKREDVIRIARSSEFVKTCIACGSTFNEVIEGHTVHDCAQVYNERENQRRAAA